MLPTLISLYHPSAGSCPWQLSDQLLQKPWGWKIHKPSATTKSSRYPQPPDSDSDHEMTRASSCFVGGKGHSMSLDPSILTGCIVQGTRRFRVGQGPWVMRGQTSQFGRKPEFHQTIRHDLAKWWKKWKSKVTLCPNTETWWDMSACNFHPLPSLLSLFLLG